MNYLNKLEEAVEALSELCIGEEDKVRLFVLALHNFDWQTKKVKAVQELAKEAAALAEKTKIAAEIDAAHAAAIELLEKK